MRFVHCVGFSALFHLALVLLVVVPGKAVLTDDQAAPPIRVSVLDEPPVIQPPPPSERPSEPIFKTDPVAQGVREGMGALAPAPRLRDPKVKPAISPDPPPDDPTADTGVAPEKPDEPQPSASDPDDSAVIAPTETGPDERASEATGTDPDPARDTRLTPDSPPSPTPAPAPARPVGDIGSGAGPGGTSDEGAGPAPRPGGPTPAPIGPGTGVDARGEANRGPGEGDSGAGHSERGSGRDEGGTATTPPPPPPKPATAHITGPPCPPTREMARLNIHGSVRVSVTVSYPGGAITSASVVSPSGYPEYDAKAAQWVRSNWRASWSGGGAPNQRTYTVSLSF